jgi:hypothetical protein
MAKNGKVRLGLLATAVLLPSLLAAEVPAQKPVDTAAKTAPQRDGGHDFDFVIGDWKAHVRRLPKRR